jgi:hypothetical protein
MVLGLEVLMVFYEHLRADVRKEPVSGHQTTPRRRPLCANFRQSALQQRVCRQLEPFVVHDLRRTLRTRLSSCVPEAVVEM